MHVRLLKNSNGVLCIHLDDPLRPDLLYEVLSSDEAHHGQKGIKVTNGELPSGMPSRGWSMCECLIPGMEVFTLVGMWSGGERRRKDRRL